MNIEVILTPAEIAGLPTRDLSACTCVVFDVLRATSTMLAAFANGARRIFPALTAEEARQMQREHLPAALLGGERGGMRIGGFDLGNSPREYTRKIVGGRDIITTTTNGTVALRACAGAKEVIVGAWVNLDATASVLRARAGTTGTLLLVCAGTGDRFAIEDGLAAGGLAARLMPEDDQTVMSDSARAMLALHHSAQDHPLAAMQSGENGRRLIQIGLGADVEWCARSNALDGVARMRDGVLEGICASAAKRE